VEEHILISHTSAGVQCVHTGQRLMASMEFQTASSIGSITFKYCNIIKRRCVLFCNVVYFR